MRCRPSLVRGRAAQVNPGGFTTPARRPSVPHRTAGCGKSSLRPLMADHGHYKASFGFCYFCRIPFLNSRSPAKNDSSICGTSVVASTASQYACTCSAASRLRYAERKSQTAYTPLSHTHAVGECAERVGPANDPVRKRQGSTPNGFDLARSTRIGSAPDGESQASRIFLIISNICSKC